MVRISGEQPPFTTTPELSEWLTRQFRQVNAGLDSVETTATSESLVNKLSVGTTSTILDSQLSATQLNIILVTVSGITITLPSTAEDKLVWFQKTYVDAGTYTVVTP